MYLSEYVEKTRDGPAGVPQLGDFTADALFDPAFDFATTDQLLSAHPNFVPTVRNQHPQNLKSHPCQNLYRQSKEPIIPW